MARFRFENEHIAARPIAFPEAENRVVEKGEGQ
jgi:hypothetical protein